MINTHPQNGSLDGLERFRILLKKFRQWSLYHRTLEDLQNKRYVIGRTSNDERHFWIKYASAFYDNLKSMGLLSFEDTEKPEQLFPYADLEESVTPDISIWEVQDLAVWLDTMWSMSLQLRQGFKRHYRTSQQYNYLRDSVDLSVFAGWFAQTIGSSDTVAIPSNNLVELLQKHYDGYSEDGRSANDFLNMYVDSKELVPIAVRIPSGILIDNYTILYFLIYLHGCTDRIIDSPNIKQEVPIIDAMRKSLGTKFEDLIRNEVFKKGFSGPDYAPKLRQNRREFEYDILAISEENQLIILADAKYRDMAPSSVVTPYTSDIVEDRRRKLCPKAQRLPTHPVRIAAMNTQCEMVMCRVGNASVAKDVIASLESPLALRCIVCILVLLK